ncbi:hypothetical protein F2Q70_00040780 [Brassica cretica]|uniref:Uncharacterized protein n=1 Tax=Brassica cretica TaxID=69181 RepID=A0A8S9K4Z5_BRACR|nr:hypothetical protein F2Q70_00040780 [Brassica cretica]
MMKASTRLDSSQTAVLHKQRRRRGSPEMNKGKVSASLCHEGNKEDSEKYSKRTVMLHSTPFFSDGRSWESQFGDFFFELVFVSSHLSCGHWRLSLWEVTSLAEIPAILGLFCRLKMKSLNLAIVLGRGRGSGIDNGAGGCSYSRSVTTLKEAGYEEDVLVEMEPS